jgi:ribulose-5-phosphate 4-epimerase/fuculose-1-phosphate aldolase
MILKVGLDQAPSPSRLIRSGAALVATMLLPLLGCDGLSAGWGPDARILDDLVTANRILAHEGIVDGYGHVSARSAEQPARFFLSRSMAPGLVTAADLMEFDLDGKPLNAAGRAAYVERFIHAAIYRARPDVQSIVHCHTPSVIPFADSSVPMRPMYHMSAFLAPGVPIFEIRGVPGASEMLVADERIGQALAGTLGGAAVVLMRGHGAVIVGSSISEAVSRSVYLDLNAKMQAEAIALGAAVTYLEPGDMPPQGDGAQPLAHARTDPYDRNWAFWKQRALGK